MHCRADDLIRGSNRSYRKLPNTAEGHLEWYQAAYWRRMASMVQCKSRSSSTSDFTQHPHLMLSAHMQPLHVHQLTRQTDSKVSLPVRCCQSGSECLDFTQWFSIVEHKRAWSHLSKQKF